MPATRPYWYEEELHARKLDALRLLEETDADALVDILGVSARELLERFPDKVAEYLRENVGE